MEWIISAVGGSARAAGELILLIALGLLLALLLRIAWFLIGIWPVGLDHGGGPGARTRPRDASHDTWAVRTRLAGMSSSP